MAKRLPTRLPRQWSRHVKSGVLHAISLAGVVLSYARGRAKGHRRLRAQLQQATDEIALLREELDIKDRRWHRSRSRRRPHYTPVQRMRILQLRAARGWTLETTAQVFLLDLHTLHLWMRRLYEQGDRALIQTVEPVNRYPDFVRHLVRQLKVLCPAMGARPMAEVLGRAGLRLAATTIRRIMRERELPPDVDPAIQSRRRRRRVVAKYPGHTWHVDLTVVPTRAGFWVPWFPFTLPQRWPFCWWVAVAVDQVSRALVGFAVFPRMLRSMKQECFRRRLLVPLSLQALRREIDCYAIWYNTHRPDTTLGGMTPSEMLTGRKARWRRIEPRPKWPHQPRRASPKVVLDVGYVAGRKHLPVIGLRRAA